MPVLEIIFYDMKIILDFIFNCENFEWKNYLVGVARDGDGLIKLNRRAHFAAHW